MDISKLHYSKEAKEAALKVVETANKEEFKEFYKNHFIEETYEKYNISKDVLRLVRKLLDISDSPKRKKHTTNHKNFSIYNDGTKEYHVYIEDGETPDPSWACGRLQRSKETCAKISKSKLGKKTWAANRTIYNNGETNIYLLQNEIVPDGYMPGSIRKSKYKACHDANGNIKYIKKEDAIPDNFIVGGTSKDTSICVASKYKKLHEFEEKNNCTLKSTVKQTYHNGWWDSTEILDKIEQIKYYGYFFIPNRYLTLIENYNGNAQTNLKYIIHKFEVENNCTLIANLINKYGQLQILNELPKIYYKKYTFISTEYIPKIEKYVSEMDMPYSKGEKDLADYIKSIYSGEVLLNTRDIIISKDTGRPIELDIYIPDKHIAIEYDGVYWHSTSSGKAKTYHEDKSKLCDELGIRLIHVYDDEWKYKQDKIKQLLKIALGAVNNKIYARNCIIKKITNPEASEFSSKTHLQGHRNATVTYGLFYDNQLVQLMSFSKTANAKANGGEWEIIRGCPGSNNIVIGGVSKLFKHFVREYNPNSVFSYCDFNKFNGRSYEALGMKFIGFTGPDKYWIINGRLVPRNARKYKELSKIATGVLWGAGSKKYLWREDVAIL